MNNKNYNENNVQPQNNEDEEEVITQLTLANLKVLMVRKGDQIIYKLPNNMQVSSIAEEQRQQLMNEIQSIHAATMQAAANAQQQQQLSQQGGGPSSSNLLDKLPQPTTAEFDAMKETARTLREEFERQQQQRSDYDCQSPSSADGKNTRRYNKTGKYSKKRQLSQNGPQQFIALQPSIQPQQTTPIQSVFPASISESSLTAGNKMPIASMDTVSQQQPSSLLSKRLPEEELQHREIKKRFFGALISDRRAVTTPDYDTPFSSVKDVIDRLLPYHIYQYPKEDLNSNQTTLEKQDETTIEIFKCQLALFENHVKLMEKDSNQLPLKVLINRQITTDQRQKIAEEQSRIAAEQAAQKQEMLRIQSENARLTALAEQQARQQMSPQQVLNFQQIQPQQQQPQATFTNRLAQANALLQNPEFINYYSQLSPESQQNLLRNREQLVALLEKQQLNHHQ